MGAGRALSRGIPITFACGTPHGGALESTLSLARQAASAGHEVCVIVASADPYRRLPRLTSLLVHVGRASERLGGLVWRLHDQLSSQAPEVLRDGHRVAVAVDVPAAARRLVPPGGLLVANSMRRLDLERLLQIARSRGTSVVWYMRESTALDHVADVGPAVDVLLANSRPLAAAASDLSERRCSYVPSVIDRAGLVKPAERAVLLAVNPVPSHGLHLLLDLARALPHRRFALQESWPLGRDLVELRRAVSRLPNVEVRERTDRSQVFRDAYALLLPHDAQEVRLSRPRVALEAQILGVPVVVSGIPGLAAVAASSDLVVDAEGEVEAWSSAIAALDGSYMRHVGEARSFADRELPTAEQIWDVFAQACRSLLEPS